MMDSGIIYFSSDAPGSRIKCTITPTQTFYYLSDTSHFDHFDYTSMASVTAPTLTADNVLRRDHAVSVALDGRFVSSSPQAPATQSKSRNRKRKEPTERRVSMPTPRLAAKSSYRGKVARSPVAVATATANDEANAGPGHALAPAVTSPTSAGDGESSASLSPVAGEEGGATPPPPPPPLPAAPVAKEPSRNHSRKIRSNVDSPNETLVQLCNDLRQLCVGQFPFNSEQIQQKVEEIEDFMLARIEDHTDPMISCARYGLNVDEFDLVFEALCITQFDLIYKESIAKFQHGTANFEQSIQPYLDAGAVSKFAQGADAAAFAEDNGKARPRVRRPKDGAATPIPAYYIARFRTRRYSYKHRLNRLGKMPKQGPFSLPSFAGEEQDPDYVLGSPAAPASAAAVVRAQPKRTRAPGSRPVKSRYADDPDFDYSPSLDL